MAKTLLSASQRQHCQTLSSQPAPTGQRARALLALDTGASQALAAEQTGLTLGQVRYCLRRFRAIGMALFDATPVAAARPKVTVAATPATPKKKSDGKKGNKKSAKKTGKKDKKDKKDKKFTIKNEKSGKKKSKEKNKKKKKK
ncbi:MAG: helix-turn-helix domain-containing protein [Alcanivorax sp.]|nr:helix-turn-helix domain-containing protein [Alcanivorax sp.]